MQYGIKTLYDETVSACIRDLDHLGNQIRCPGAACSGRLNIGFRGVLNHVYTSVSSYNLYILRFASAHTN